MQKDLEKGIKYYVYTFQKKLDVVIDWNCSPLGVYSFADMYINFSDIVFIVDNKMTFEQVNKWYWDYWYGNPELENKVNIENYFKYFKGFANGKD